MDSREPVAKRGVFVDPFTSDRYRDGGIAQDAAVFEGSCQLAIDPTVFSCRSRRLSCSTGRWRRWSRSRSQRGAGWSIRIPTSR
ncbi:MAG: DUF4815 domain-containing protein [Alphaproteobacteria bacterium]|nr:DUF4815 domain-containing protein [Alphaproteobacteria bacterium]